jgi:ATP phosphoribosyltransferase regulatory subunit
MSTSPNKDLLPDGLRDALPPDAAHEAAIVEQLLRLIGAHGYDRVDPPLVEFEDSLLDGAGHGVELATFRLMDPVSQRMMGVRADITPQVARIAATRLAKVARPLRLAYAGPVLRVRGDQLRPERQFYEVGVELIGTDRADADAEVIALAAEALMSVGVRDVSVDINLPTLTPTVCRVLELDDETSERARLALDRKDAAAVAALGGQAALMLGGLLTATGPLDEALAALQAVDLPPSARAECQRLEMVACQVAETVPALTLTIDPAENRGFEYHTGLSFTLFAKGVRGSLGRGGRYVAGGGAEPAIGFTLFLDSIARAVPLVGSDERVFLPHGTPVKHGRALRDEGWTTVAGLEPGAEVTDKAVRMNCTHVLIDGHPVAIATNKE